MMKQSYPNASGGLNLMFISQILAIVGIFLSGIAAGLLAAALLTGDVGGALVMGVLALIVSIVSVVLQIVGLYKAGTDDEGYRTPLYAAIGSLAVVVLSYFLGSVSILSTLLSIVSAVLSFIIVSGVCQTTGNLLHSVGNEALVDRGATVSKIYLICTIVNVVCIVISVVPFLSILGGLVSIVAAIVQLVGYILYLSFLSSGSKALA